MERELIMHLASLSKIEFSENELDGLGTQMDNIVNLMDKVKGFESNNNTRREGRPYDAIRADEALASYAPDDILKNSSTRKGNFFVVPKVVE